MLKKQLRVAKNHIMNTYFTILGWWNLIGSLLMIGFFNESFGKKVLNDWTRIFATEFKLDYWSKFWLAWAIGLNIFFALINILVAYYDVKVLMLFILIFDLIAYAAFISLAVWGALLNHLGKGINSVFIIFFFWLAWGICLLF